MLAHTFYHNLDAKNRLFIPAAFREALGPRFMVVRSLRTESIKLFSQTEWEKYIAPIRSLPRKDSEQIFRYLYSDAIEADPDAQGRIILPQSLVKYAKIEKNAVINGCGDFAEIWAQEIYDRTMENIDTEAMLANLEKFNL